MSPKKRTDETFEGAFAKRLGRAVRSRRVSLAKRIVDECIGCLDTSPPSRDTLTLVAQCAWAIDLYGPYIEQVERAVNRFRRIPAGEINLYGHAALNTADALVKYHREEYADALALFEKARDDADRAGDAELATVSRYYLGRTQFKLTNYETALEYIGDAIRRDLASGNQVRAASMELDAGWLCFLRGDVKEAQRRLSEARKILSRQPKAYIDRGNTLSFQGRLYREYGQYDASLECYFEAIKTYGGYDPGYRNVARCRRNIAVIYRIMARELDSKKVSKGAAPQAAQDGAQAEELRALASAELHRALEIYGFDASRYHHGLGIVHITLALIYFDALELDRAAQEAQHAYEYGKAKGDYIVMAEARVIQAGVELEGYRGVGNPDLALKLANEAIQLGEKTYRHRRLLARAHICKGHALLELTPSNPTGARRCYEQAKSNLVAEDRDYLRGMLDALEAEVDKRGHFSSLDIQLSECYAPGMTLNEVTEIVQEQFLRHVYERCGRSIHRAAAELKTGARKVRNAVSDFKLTEESLKKLEADGVGAELLDGLACLKGKEVKGRASFEWLVKEKAGGDWDSFIKLVRKHARRMPPH